LNRQYQILLSYVKILGTGVLFVFFYCINHKLHAQEPASAVDTIDARQYTLTGDSLMRSRAFDSAAYCYNKAAGIYRDLDLLEDFILNLAGEGKAWFYHRDIEKASELVNEAIETCIKQYGDSSILLIDCYRTRSRILEAKVKYSEAVDNMLLGLELCIHHYGYNHSQTASFLGNLGIYYKILGEYQLALDYYKKSEKVFRNLYGDEDRMIAAAYNNIGIIYAEIGKIDSALIMHQNALAIRLKLFGQDHLHTAASYNNMAAIYYQMGDYQQALDNERKVLNIRLKLIGREHPLTALTYSNIGAIHENTGRYDQSLLNHLIALEIREQVLPEMHPEMAASYTNLANMYKHFDELDKSLQYHEKSLAIKLEVFGENHPEIPSTLNNIGDAYHWLKEYEKANLKFREAVESLKRLYPSEVHPSLALYYVNIAKNYKEMPRLDSAMAYVQKAIASNKKPEIRRVVVEDTILSEVVYMKSLAMKAELHSLIYLANPGELRQLESAIDMYMRTIALMDKIRFSYFTNESKLFLAKESANIFSEAMNNIYLLYRKTDDESLKKDLFDIIEKSKSAVLYEMIAQSRATDFSGIPDSLVNHAKWLNERIHALKIDANRLEEQNDSTLSPELSRLYDEIFNQQTSYINLIKLLESTYPRYKQLKYNTEIHSLEKIAGLLGENSVVLNYFIADTLLYVYTISKDENGLFVIDIGADFEDEVLSFLRAIKKYRIDDFNRGNEALYKILIEPVESAIKGKSELIIIPDKYLYCLPFETLYKPATGNNPPDFTNNDYLVKVHNISYHYSNTLYCQILQENKTETGAGGFIGFAPVFSSDRLNNQVTHRGASIFDSLNFNNYETLRSISIDGKTYNHLPYSEKEVSSIASLFKDRNLNAAAYLYGQANEISFKNNIPDYQYIHLATHGIVNEKNPNLSGIIFAQPENEPGEKELADVEPENAAYDDGILFAGEMYNLDLNADLVVLSACETGLGRIVNGEGIMSMTRGFIYSGTPNILFSLWKVGDKNTYELMVNLYTDIIEGDTYSKALRKAKLRLIQNEATAFPVNWAGFTLVGVN
jgi:CHAT domain-containing protein/Tfp pilus assembly protein PilF